MKAILHWPSTGRQRGFTLVELMIGMTLGLILLIALAYFFLGSRQLNRTHDDVSRMQESGRHALEILGRAIRQAGYRANSEITFLAAFPTNPSLAGMNGTPDSITARYAAQEGGEADCTGANVAAGALVTYAFTVNGLRELICNNGAVNMVVADNIENMQITYGIDADRNGVIESYTVVPPATAALFGQVAVVRVNLVVRGPTPNAATGGDGFLRQGYTATFTVRNQAG